MAQKSPTRPGLHLLALALITLSVTFLAGCGGSDSPAADAPRPPDYDRKLADSPKPLAMLHAESSALLPGGVKGFQSRIRSLYDFPIVVNVWASWCGPCREEFPIFQQVSADQGREVAFLGVDFDDDREAARTFLESYPVPYPSYLDPDKSITNWLRANRGIPATAFFDDRGEQTHVKYGPYRNRAELEADIERYARTLPDL
jgi:cytochrome c biogenesis protein CcmG/thiol:disulfide interchange protein DsbE